MAKQKKHGNSFLVAAAAYGMTGGGGGGDADTLQGQNGAYYLTRTNHTGTQLAATVSNFAATVATLPAASATTATTATNANALQSQNGGYYLSRTNHSGTQTAATISDFAAAVALLPAASATTATTATDIAGSPAASRYYGTDAGAVKGFFPLPGAGSIAGKLILEGGITPPIIGAHTDNYSPTGLSTANVLFLSSSANYDLTGIVAQENGRVLFLVNNGTSSIKLKNNNANSLAVNRFFLRADATIQGGNGGIIIYEASISRWHLVAIY